MSSVVKLALYAILISIVVVFLSKMAALIPFYITMVTEAFTLANISAADNYLKRQHYEDSLEGLRSRPLYNVNADEVRIYVLNEDGAARLQSDVSNRSIEQKLASLNSDHFAIGENNEFVYNATNGPFGKPYRQRGRPIQIIVTAVYPFQFMLWGRPAGFDVPVSFSITTIGLKYYKDLDADYFYEAEDPYW